MNVFDLFDDFFHGGIGLLHLIFYGSDFVGVLLCCLHLVGESLNELAKNIFELVAVDGRRLVVFSCFRQVHIVEHMFNQLIFLLIDRLRCWLLQLCLRLLCHRQCLRGYASFYSGLISLCLCAY